MQKFVAPLIKGNDKLDSAIKLLNKSQHPAIVVELEEKNVLFPSRYVFRGYSYGLELCNQLDIKNGFLLMNTDNSDEISEITHLPVNESYQIELEELMDLDDYKFAILSGVITSETNELVLITRSESFLTLIAGQNIICVCSGLSRHLVEGVDGLDGKNCKICGNLYVCTTSI